MLIDAAKEAVPRCLTPAQRSAASLGDAPSDWCIAMGKWPYDTQDWRDWLRYRDAKAPLPNTPQWQQWLASRVPPATK